MTEKILSPDSYVFETIVIEDLDHVLSITLNRPEKKNAINDVMSNEIIYALNFAKQSNHCLLYTSPSPRDGLLSRMPSSA